MTVPALVLGPSPGNHGPSAGVDTNWQAMTKLQAGFIEVYGYLLPVLPSGDVTGATDAAAINALIAAGNPVQLVNGTYYVNATISINVIGSQLLGMGRSTYLSAVGLSSTTPVILMGGSATRCNVGNFSITGTAGNALKASGPSGGTHIHDIWVEGGSSWVDIFWFQSFYSNQVDNLWCSVGATTSHYHFDGSVNACTFTSLQTAGSNYPPYNFYLSDDHVGQPSTGNVFNACTPQNGSVGLYVGNNWWDTTFNSLYFEGSPTPIQLGDGTHYPRALTFNSPSILAPYSGHPNYANRIAGIDVQSAIGVTINSPSFLCSAGLGQQAILTFSGGSPGYQAQAIAHVNPNTGVISSYVIIDGGTTYGSAPTVTVTQGGGGTGSGANITANLTGGVVTSLTIVSGGTNYNTGSYSAYIPPIRIGGASNRISVHNPAFSAGGPGQNTQAMYPWVVLKSGLNGNAGLSIFHDLAPYPSSIGWAGHADLIHGTNTTNAHYLRYYTSTTPTTVAYTPQVFP